MRSETPVLASQSCLQSSMYAQSTQVWEKQVCAGMHVYQQVCHSCASLKGMGAAPICGGVRHCGWRGWDLWASHKRNEGCPHWWWGEALWVEGLKPLGLTKR